MTDGAKESPIHFDPDNIDVADIMTQVKRRAAETPRGDAVGETAASCGGGPETAAPAGGGGLRGRLKRGLKMLVRPYMPFIVPLIERFKFKMTYDVNVRIDGVATDLNLNKEHTKMLHSLGHNLVVELTKLKIEEEGLKSRIRILEKDLETLGKRERVIEKRVVE